MNYRDIFESVKRNAVTADLGPSRQLPAGCSKFGGQPDLPAGFEWPYFAEKDKPLKPLSFLLQINCADVAPHDAENRLPKTGILYFFYELESMTWGFDPKDKGSARVYHYRDAPLSSTPFPTDMTEEAKLPERPLNFSHRPDFPDAAEYEERGFKGGFPSDYDAYEELREDMSQASGKETVKLLGYADIIQNSMLMECEMSTNGIYNGNVVKLDPLTEARMRQKSLDWRLLLQLKSLEEEEDGVDLMFGDLGHIYYCIKDEDLRQQNFENCWLVLQCY